MSTRELSALLLLGLQFSLIAIVLLSKRPRLDLLLVICFIVILIFIVTFSAGVSYFS